MNGQLTKQEFAFLKRALRALEAYGQQSLNGNRKPEITIIDFYFDGLSKGKEGIVADLGILIDKIEKIEGA